MGTITLREALSDGHPHIHHVYFQDGGSPINPEDYHKYLDCTGNFEDYEDDDGEDEHGRPIILHDIWFILDITKKEGDK